MAAVADDYSRNFQWCHSNGPSSAGDGDTTVQDKAVRFPTDSKGKVYKRNELRVKASIAVTNRSNFVVGGLALPGKPYDGHTLRQALDQVCTISEQRIEEVYVDRGYRSYDKIDCSVYISGQKRRVAARIRKF